MDYIYPNLYLETFKRLPYLKLDIGELDLEIVDGLKSTADAAIGLAGGYDEKTGDLCALAISTQKRILIITFQDTTATEAPPMLANSILLNPSLKKYAFSAPRLIISLPAILPSLRSKEVYDALPKNGRYKPHSTSSVISVLGSSIINEENVIEVFSSEICDHEDLKHTFNIALRAWAACHVANKGKSSNLKTTLPFDTSSLTDDVCCSLLYATSCDLL